MNILQLTHIFPYPLDDGGKIGIYNITKQFALHGAKVYYAGLLPYTPEPSHVEAIRQWCEDMILLPVDKSYSMKSLIRNFFSPVPINIHKYQSRKILHTIKQFISDKNIDIIHTDHLHMAYYGLALKKMLAKPAVLREHNLEMKIMKRFGEHQTNLVIKGYAGLQSLKFKYYEPAMCQAFDQCIMITPEDEAALQQSGRHANTTIIPAGVDTDVFKPVINSGDDLSLAWIGNMEWWPNLHGLKYFLHEIFPRIQKDKPNVKLFIFGKNPDNEVRQLHDDRSIFVKGYVEDIRDAFHSAKVIIVPLYVGGGIRIKILESMAMGKAIVTTSIGCEGIDTYSKECFLVADGPDDFANKTCLLLDQEERRIQLGQNAVEMINLYYSWNAIGKRFIEYYNKIIGKNNT